jgi:enamine deaminase RidA (YjgF/YER057c/UK114 family)
LPQVRALFEQPLAEECPLIRKSFSSGYPFEDVYGYARAVRVGNHVFVSGTTARPPHLDGDAYQQMTNAIGTVAKALGEAGAELRHVVRTVVYILDMADAHHVARAHDETFAGSRPASTLVQVAALTPDQARVEIEVTAVIHD